MAQTGWFDAATEASYFADDAPTVVFGPGVLSDEDGPVAHGDREYIHGGEMKAGSESIRTPSKHSCRNVSRID